MLKRLYLISLTPVLICGLLTAAVAQQSTMAPEAVEQAWQAAIAAGAAELATKPLDDAQDVLNKARRDSEKGNEEKSAERYQEAWELFRKAELTALQNRILAEVRNELTSARKQRAKKYAPITLARAEQLAAEARTMLANNRNDLVGAEARADDAAATARLAQQISKIAKQKPGVEELLLEHARGLWQLQSAAGITQRADQKTAAATAALEGEIRRLREAERQLSIDLSDSRTYAAALEEEIRLLDQQLGGASAERRELVMQLELQARAREQLEQAKKLFSPDEAVVFKQSGAIVARLTGLNFNSGSAELGADADVLFTKIRRLVNIFPGAQITVEGHTDSKGGDRLNQKLSQNRAQTVMNRMIRDAAIPADRITATGFGETRPIANNETETGRAQNRRIDLLIMPASN